MKSMPVDILLATHNGASFIEELVASIFAQRYSSFRLLVRDDGSTDETPEILQSLSRVHSGKIRIIELSRQVRGTIFGYSQMLQQSDADYVMFCDQDDVWLNFKMKKSMERMEQLETAGGKHVPILVHTDLKVVDEKLTPINDSFAAYQRLNPQRVELNRLLVKNVVTGCTMTMNRSLKRLIGDIPLDVRMHDWWIALVASLFGVVDFIEEPTVLYRQHNLNVVGAKPVTVKTIINRLQNVSQLKTDFEKNFYQVRSLLRRYGNRMADGDKQSCHDFLSLTHATVPVITRTIIRNRFFSHGLWRNVGLFMLVSGVFGKLSKQVDFI